MLKVLWLVKLFGLGGKSSFRRFLVCRRPPSTSFWFALLLFAASDANVFRVGISVLNCFWKSRLVLSDKLPGVMSSIPESGVTFSANRSRPVFCK